MKNELSIQALKHLNFNLDDNDQDIIYTIHVYLLINDIVGLIKYLDQPQVINILQEHEWFFKDYTNELTKHLEFCVWFKNVFGKEFGI